MKDLLKQLYPNDLDFVLEQVSCLKRKYNPDNSKDLSKLTHQDCILITYGDAIFEPSRTPLSSLKRFADEYLKEGISAIHLLPCFPYTSDDGFSVVDYYEINSELGSWKDIDELKITFDIMFDAVVNHMSKKSSWFQAFLKGTETFDTYFIEADPNADYSDVVRPRALPLLHKFDKQGKEVYVWTTFSEDQVDLNYRSAKVFIQVLDVLLFYIHKGARYIRLDAIAFLWKTMGTSCIHLKETHLVIQAYRQVFNEIAPHAIIITETNVPHVENVSYFGNGSNEAHMVYNFTLPPLLAHSIHEQEISTLTKWAKSLSLPSSETCFFNFTASHDGVGVRPLQGIIADKEISRLAEKAELHGGFVSYKDNGDGTKSPYELNCNYMDLITHPSSENTIRAQRFLLTQSVML
ncbi:MAG: alpha-amylase family glycosyl hydrolase, partial [Bacteroidota bacterium]